MFAPTDLELVEDPVFCQNSGGAKEFVGTPENNVEVDMCYAGVAYCQPVTGSIDRLARDDARERVLAVGGSNFNDLNVPQYIRKGRLIVYSLFCSLTYGFSGLLNRGWWKKSCDCNQCIKYEQYALRSTREALGNWTGEYALPAWSKWARLHEDIEPCYK